MKHPITLRIDNDLLEASRHHAQKENRTLTNFVETVLRLHIAKATLASADSIPNEEHATKTAVGRPGAKRSPNRKSVHG